MFSFYMKWNINFYHSFYEFETSNRAIDLKHEDDDYQLKISTDKNVYHSQLPSKEPLELCMYVECNVTIQPTIYRSAFCTLNFFHRQILMLINDYWLVKLTHVVFLDCFYPMPYFSPLLLLSFILPRKCWITTILSNFNETTKLL